MSFLARLGRPVLRTLQPETAHNLTISLLAKGVGVPSAPPLVTRDPRLAVELPVSGLRLPNPIGLAAGFDKNAEAFSAMLRHGFGFVEAGTVTPLPQDGNPKPRLFRLTEDRAVINRMGFNNQGLEPFVKRLYARDRAGGIVGANVGANKTSEDRVADYMTGMNAVWAQADYVTLNISSPNTPGLRGLQDREALEALLRRAAEARRSLEAAHGPRPVFLKVAPDLDETAIAEICEVALGSGALTGLIVSNTTLARPDTLKSVHRGETGGLSGAPLMQASTEVLGRFAQHLKGELDLIGAGGIGSDDDVRAKLAAGAQAVQLYSALVYEGVELVSRICADLMAETSPGRHAASASAR